MLFIPAFLILAWIWPKAGKLRIPVAIYILAITLMVWWALCATILKQLPITGALGAILFFLSDILVARRRFIRPQFLNQAVGLPMYYAAQLLLAGLM